MQSLAKQSQELLGLQLSPAQLEALAIYQKELLEWNERVNLTAIRDPDQVLVKHFLDSFTCVCGEHPEARENLFSFFLAKQAKY